MRQAGLWIAVVPVAFALALLGRSAVVAHYQLDDSVLTPGLLDLLTLAVPGALLWLAGWIVDGFTKDSR